MNEESKIMFSNVRKSKDGDVVFRAGGEEMLRLCSYGKEVYVRGRLCCMDAGVVDGFRAWLKRVVPGANDSGDVHFRSGESVGDVDGGDLVLTGSDASVS